MKKPEVLLVARVSDVEQRKALPAQKKRLLEYAERKKWIENVNFRYVEFDETAFKKDRKTFNELVIKPLQENNELNTVVFDKIDRFSRDSSSSEKALLTRLFESGKIELHFPSDNLFISKASPAADRFRLDIGVSLASYYSASIRDNVKRRFEQLLSEGIWVHKAPVGYKNITIPGKTSSQDTKNIVIDDQRAHYIAKVFELRALGTPYGLIAKSLLESGYTSRKTGKARLTKSDIEKIINNKFYYGTMTHNNKEYEHFYPRIITRALFNECQRVNEGRQARKTKWDSLNYTLSDIVTCGKCGRSVSPFKSKKWVYLTCANPKCDNPNTAESLVMGSIEALIRNIRIPENMIENVITQLKTKHDEQQSYYVQSIDAIRTEQDGIDKKLESFFDKLVEERISPEQHDKIVATLHSRRDDLNDKLDSLTQGDKNFQVTASYLLDLIIRAEQLFEEGTNEQRSKLLGFLLSNLKMNDKKLTYTVNCPFNLVIEQNKSEPNGSDTSFWCGYRDSNPGPHPWQGCALTAELHPHTLKSIAVSGDFFKGETGFKPFPNKKSDRNDRTFYLVAPPRLELGTRGSSIRCSTN